jgi:hypothetical protein
MMKRFSSCPSLLHGTLAALLVCSAGLLCGTLSAQSPDPANWEFELRAPNESYKPGDAFQATSGMVSKLAGPQGWSYGVKHDIAVLDAEKVTADGTDALAIFSGGFNQTVLIEQGGNKVGYIQAIILSFVQPIVVPVDDYFTMAIADYKVKAGACDGKSGNFSTKLEYTAELAVPNSPPVDINVTVEGKSLVPSKLAAKDLTIECEATPPPAGLALKFDKADTDLVADRTSLYDLKVQLTNGQTAAGVDVQGWSYGVRLDAAELEATAGAPGVDSQALKGGKGPDFTNYALDESNTGGTIRGVTVGAVIDLDSPANNVLPVGPGATRHIDTIKLRTRTEIAPGGQSRTTQLGFTDQLGGDRPLEVLVVVAGNGIVPDFTDTLTLTLLPRTDAAQPSFIRGDANNDRRVDIADGIWIVNFLFYGGTMTACLPAADANSDSQRNVSDAMFIFNYQLQPGKTPGSQLFPAPGAPFPNCGTAAGVTLADCPRGSTLCSS